MINICSNRFSLKLYLGILTAIIGVVSLQTGIFWDNVTFVSAMGNALYENGVFCWNSIPINSDPGHPPFLATLMAASWHIFGRSLFISHIVLLPFIYGLLCQVWSVCAFYVKTIKDQILCFALVISDATFLSQTTLVSTEVPLMFFFFLSLNGILYGSQWRKALGLSLLGIVSLRGMMLCGGLFLVDIILNKRYIQFKPYLIGAIPAIAYIIWRLVAKGWIISNPEKAFGDALDYGSMGFIKNIIWNTAVIGQRFLDFGRFLIIIFLFILLVFYKYLKIQRYRNILATALLPTSIVGIVSLFIVNPIGHRYFTVSYMLLTMLAFILLKETNHKILFYCMMLISLIAGNFIVYPDKMAQGWDSSLAHLNYWNLRRNMIEYMDQQKIDIDKTATFFPNAKEIDAVDLNNDNRKWADFTSKEPYVFYSNVFNVSDEELDEINRNYILIKSYKSLGVRVELYKQNIYNQ